MESKEKSQFYCDHTRIMFDIRIHFTIHCDKTAQLWKMIHKVVVTQWCPVYNMYIIRTRSIDYKLR